MIQIVWKVIDEGEAGFLLFKMSEIGIIAWIDLLPLLTC